MSNPKTYFVTLTPRQLFFFGGEQGETADYYLKGSFIPQQTALLGLVRHQVLLQNRLKSIQNKTYWAFESVIIVLHVRCTL